MVLLVLQVASLRNVEVLDLQHVLDPGTICIDFAHPDQTGTSQQLYVVAWLFVYGAI